MKFITYDSIPSLPAFIADLTTRIADPGAFITREDIGTGDGARAESVSRWGARAIANMFTTDEASDGSAPARGETYLASLQAHSQTGVSDFRALLDSAKGVTADQLELTLARGHLKEAARAFEGVRAENNQLRNYMRVAGSLLGRADRDPVQLAAKIEAGIIAVNEDLRLTKETVERLREKEALHTESNGMLAQERDRCRAAYAAERERVNDLEREADKARRVIVGNVVVEDNGSLLDMLNAVLTKLTEERVQYRQHAEQAATDRANLAHADEKIRELQQFIASNAPQVSGSSGAL